MNNRYQVRCVYGPQSIHFLVELIYYDYREDRDLVSLIKICDTEEYAVALAKQLETVTGSEIVYESPR